MVFELKSRGWLLSEIEQLNSLELESALIWCANKTATENAQLLNAETFNLLAQNKKSQQQARSLSQKLTKTKAINPKHRPTLIDTIKQWAGMSGFKS